MGGESDFAFSRESTMSYRKFMGTRYHSGVTQNRKKKFNQIGQKLGSGEPLQREGENKKVFPLFFSRQRALKPIGFREYLQCLCS